jgi:hypothetical protein
MINKRKCGDYKPAKRYNSMFESEKIWVKNYEKKKKELKTGEIFVYNEIIYKMVKKTLNVSWGEGIWA